MGKRKRVTEEPSLRHHESEDNRTTKITKVNGHLDSKSVGPSIQIITGSYERILHGITARISISSSSSPPASVQFEDTFLFNAHASAIRCLALSPITEPTHEDSQSIYLATGGSDEKINVYQLSTSPALQNDINSLVPILSTNKVSENPRNRELGAIINHSSNVTSLHFPTRSKLLSASDDNTIAISRVRDLTVVSTIKAPRPKVLGQPSGDTSAPGLTPAGVNDFAVHPSQKLMISVGKGERCMRLWNLVQGKRVGALNFTKDILLNVKEGKYSSGEGRKIRWNKAGTEFAIAFERGVMIFGEDSKAKSKIIPQPLTKVHQIRYINGQDSNHKYGEVLVVSTEDGRLIFYDTKNVLHSKDVEEQSDSSIPEAKTQTQLNSNQAGVRGRIKDFQVLSLPANEELSTYLIIVTASSDGAIRTWLLPVQALDNSKENDIKTHHASLIGTYETANRVTCLEAFVMSPGIDDDELGLSEFESGVDGEDSSSDGNDA